MSIERKQRKIAVEAAIANNAAIEAAGKGGLEPPKSVEGSPAFAKKSKKSPGESNKHKSGNVTPSS
jgi:hypothetical protein